MTKGETTASNQIVLAVERPEDVGAYLDVAVVLGLEAFIEFSDGLIDGQDHVSARQCPEITPGSCRASCRLAA